MTDGNPNISSQDSPSPRRAGGSLTKQKLSTSLQERQEERKRQKLKKKITRKNEAAAALAAFSRSSSCSEDVAAAHKEEGEKQPEQRELNHDEENKTKAADENLRTTASTSVHDKSRRHLNPHNLQSDDVGNKSAAYWTVGISLIMLPFLLYAVILLCVAKGGHDNQDDHEGVIKSTPGQEHHGFLRGSTSSSQTRERKFLAPTPSLPEEPQDRYVLKDEQKQAKSGVEDGAEAGTGGGSSAEDSSEEQSMSTVATAPVENVLETTSKENENDGPTLVNKLAPEYGSEVLSDAKMSAAFLEQDQLQRRATEVGKIDVVQIMERQGDETFEQPTLNSSTIFLGQPAGGAEKVMSAALASTSTSFLDVARQEQQRSFASQLRLYKEQNLKAKAPLAVLYQCRYPDERQETILDKAARGITTPAHQDGSIPAGTTLELYDVPKRQCMSECTRINDCSSWLAIVPIHKVNGQKIPSCLLGGKHANPFARLDQLPFPTDYGPDKWEIFCAVHVHSGSEPGQGVVSTARASPTPVVARPYGQQDAGTGFGMWDAFTAALDYIFDDDEPGAKDALVYADDDDELEFGDASGDHGRLDLSEDPLHGADSTTKNPLAKALQRHGTCGRHWWSHSRCRCMRWEGPGEKRKHGHHLVMHKPEESTNGFALTAVVDAQCPRSAKINSVCRSDFGSGQCIFECRTRYCQCVQDNGNFAFPEGNAACTNRWDGFSCGVGTTAATCRAKPPRFNPDELCVMAIDAAEAINPFAVVPDAQVPIHPETQLQARAIGGLYGEVSEKQFFELATLDSNAMVAKASETFHTHKDFLIDAHAHASKFSSLAYSHRVREYIFVPIRGWLQASPKVPKQLVQVLNLAVEGALTYMAVVAYGSVPAIAIPLAIYRSLDFYCTGKVAEADMFEEEELDIVQKQQRLHLCGRLLDAKDRHPKTTKGVLALVRTLDLILTGSNLGEAVKELFSFAKETASAWEVVKAAIGDERAAAAEAFVAAAAAVKSLAYAKTLLMRQCMGDAFQAGVKKIAGVVARHWSLGNCLERTRKRINPETGALEDDEGFRNRWRQKAHEWKGKLKAVCPRFHRHGKEHDEPAAVAKTPV
ncbi:unnamed protein product [Amoebophrya sp. A120]|nr:unnamed protein product [Amoebophrya sp. A120]|eukprot:GSA120T00025563001.1